jgi:hypothetical protein
MFELGKGKKSKFPSGSVDQSAPLDKPCIIMAVYSFRHVRFIKPYVC